MEVGEHLLHQAVTAAAEVVLLVVSWINDILLGPISLEKSLKGLEALIIGIDQKELVSKMSP